MREGQTMQAKNLSEKGEMSTDWLLKYRGGEKKKKVSAVPRTTYNIRDTGKTALSNKSLQNLYCKIFLKIFLYGQISVVC